jgi:hypothetical protein
MDHSKVIEAIKDLPTGRFIMLWIWLVIMSLTPIGWIVAVALAWKSR